MMQYAGTQYLNFSISPRGLATAFCLLCAGFGANAQQTTIAEAIDKCSQESNSLQRLVCYDRMAKSMRQYSGTEEVVSQVLPPVAPPTAARPDLPATPATGQTAAPPARAEDQFG